VNTQFEAISFFLNQVKDVDQICKPLYDLGIKFFSYSQLSLNNTLLYLSNNPYYIDYKFTHNILNGYRHVHDSLSKGINSNLYLTDRTNQLTDARANLSAIGYPLGIDIYESFETYKEIFHFAGAETSQEMVECFNGNPWVYNRFIQYFKNYFTKSLYSPRTPRYQIDEQYWEIGRGSACKRESALQDRLLKFKEQTQFSQVFLEHDNVSLILKAREYDVLKLLNQGLKSKEIARILVISPRTVEEYIGKLKIKFKAKSKGDLCRSTLHSMPVNDHQINLEFNSLKSNHIIT